MPLIPGHLQSLAAKTDPFLLRQVFIHKELRTRKKGGHEPGHTSARGESTEDSRGSATQFEDRGLLLPPPSPDGLVLTLLPLLTHSQTLSAKTNPFFQRQVYTNKTLGSKQKGGHDPGPNRARSNSTEASRGSAVQYEDRGQPRPTQSLVVLILLSGFAHSQTFAAKTNPFFQIQVDKQQSFERKQKGGHEPGPTSALSESTAVPHGSAAQSDDRCHPLQTPSPDGLVLILLPIVTHSQTLDAITNPFFQTQVDMKQSLGTKRNGGHEPGPNHAPSRSLSRHTLRSRETHAPLLKRKERPLSPAIPEPRWRNNARRRSPISPITHQGVTDYVEARRAPGDVLSSSLLIASDQRRLDERVYGFDRGQGAWVGLRVSPLFRRSAQIFSPRWRLRNQQGVGR